MNLSEEQQRVLELTDQYSVFITGRAGTGKTFLPKQIIDFYQRKHGLDGVGVTASTGKAAQPLGGFTFHSFFGIGSGRLSAYQLVHNIKAQDDLCKKIENLHVLFQFQWFISKFQCWTLLYLKKLNSFAGRSGTTLVHLVVFSWFCVGIFSTTSCT